MISETWKIELWDRRYGRRVGVIGVVGVKGKGVEGVWGDWGEGLVRAGRMKVEEWYVLGRRIGVGHYGAVYEGWDKKSGEKVAVKIVEKGKEGLSRKEREVYVRREREVVTLIGGHGNVIRTLDVFDEKKRLIIVMEFADGGNVLQWVRGKRSSENKVKVMAGQVVSAVAWLHGLSVIHRDIKPENLLVRDGVVKLCDFGLSRVLSNVCSTKEYNLSSICGTPVYVAPEVARKESYSFPVDMWSCGVLIYVLMSGRLPFSGDTIEDVLKNVAACNGAVDFPMEKWSHVSPMAKDFIQKLLAPNPADRLTANEALSHPWLKSCSLPQTKVQASVLKSRMVSSGSYRTMSPGESLENVMRTSSSSRALRPMSSSTRTKLNASPTTLRHQWSSHNHSSQFSRFQAQPQPQSNSFRRQVSSGFGANQGMYRQDSNNVFQHHISSNSLREQFSAVTNEDSFDSHFGRSPSAKEARIVRSVSNRDRFKLKFLRNSFGRHSFGLERTSGRV